MAEITLPQLGETVTEGTITRWFKKIGETVAADEPLFEVSTDKVDTEVPSPIAGVLTEIRVQEGDTVAVGTVIAVVGDASAASAGATQAAAVPAETVASSNVSDAEPASAPSSSAEPTSTSAQDASQAAASGVRKIDAPEAEALDLLSVGGSTIAKMALPVLAIAAVVIWFIVK